MKKPLREYRFSLRARATSWYVGLLAVALAMFSVGIYVGIRTYLKASLQRALSSTAHTIADEYLSRLPDKGEAWVLGEVRESYAASPSDRYVRLSVGDKVLYQTADMRDPAIQISDIALPRSSATGSPRPLVPQPSEGEFHRETIHGRVVLIYSLAYKGPDGRLIELETGTSLFSMQQTMLTLTKMLVVVTIPILILATIGGYLLMKQPLRPLVVLTDKAANIGLRELGERLPVIRTGDELERLTHSLNGMIDRLEDALNHNHRFSADASHELRTPLTIMRGEIEEMLRIEELPPQAVGNLVSTLDEIDRMSRIVNSLMVITRLDAGSERMDMEVLDLSALARNTMDHMRLLADEKGLPLTYACDGAVYIHGSPMRIKQVLVNLIDNAIKYSLPSENLLDPSAPELACGGVDVTISASGTTAMLRITDRGVGIAPEVLPHVFERFYRADFARSRVAGGVGLGLAIVKAIVIAHEGSVSITSTLGQGSTVVVELPLVKPSAVVTKDELVRARKQSRYQTT